MWTKTLTVEYKKQKYQVQVWLSEEDENNKCIVSVQSIVNDWFLGEDILFPNRDSAYDFIKNYPLTMAKAFIIREGYNTEAFN